MKNPCTESIIQFFDLKTKQILRYFHFSFLNFITKIEKKEAFFEIYFLILNQKVNSKVLIFVF